ncbi:MAG: DNA-processing protein DprA [Deltaproteobacteria bacterium]
MAWNDGQCEPYARLVGCGEEDFPPSLLQIHDPPEAIWVRGCLNRLRELLCLPAIGIVGGRDCTAQGEATARRLGYEIASAGFVVVSGLARGIDAAAHRGALEAKGRTVAVIGCGPDIVYPQANARLRRAILKQGLLLGEQKPGTPPLKQNFPARNRLISGLSAGVVVVEARKRSGSLITARLALEQGREVFAVPSAPLLPRAAGTNGLLKAGAGLVENLDDILQALPWLSQVLDKRAAPEDDGPLTQGVALLGWIREGAETVDDLARLSGRRVDEIQRLLLDLELGGRVHRGADGRIFVA